MSNLSVDGTSTWVNDIQDNATPCSDGPTGTVAVSALFNGLLKFAIDLQTTLGTASALLGNETSLDQRLNRMLSADGTLPNGPTFPVSPTPKNGQLFYNTTDKIVYVYDASVGQWVPGFTNILYALLDGSNMFNGGKVTIKGSNPYVRLIGSEVGGSDYIIREIGGTLKTYVNTGSEAIPIWTEDNFFCPTSMIVEIGTDIIPPGWLYCNGQAVSRTTYPRLHAIYAAKGYPYGTGDGVTTFNVPDKRGRTTIGLDAGTGRVTAASANGANANTQGGVGGLETNTLLETQIPQLGYFLTADPGTFEVSSGVNNFVSNPVGPYLNIRGSAQPHSNTQPWQAGYFMVKT